MGGSNIDVVASNFVSVAAVCGDDTSDFKDESSDLTEVAVKDRDFQAIKVQLSALGLIEKSRKNRGVRDTGLYWSLTPFGESALNTVRAIRRTPPSE